MIDLNIDKMRISSKLPEQFFEGLCDLFLELGVDGHEFINNFTKHYVQRTAKVVKTKSDIYSATGFSEYKAKKYLSNPEHKNYPKRKHFYLILINRLKELSEQSENGSIPIHGKFKSFIATYNDTNYTDNTVTALSMLKKLIKLGVIEKIDNKNIRFVTSLQRTGENSPDGILKLLANLVNRASATLLNNLLAKNNDDTLFQMAYFSNAVHPENFKVLSDILRKEQRKDFRKYQKIIDSYEEKGLKRKWVESLNLEIGLTALTFKTQLRNNYVYN